MTAPNPMPMASAAASVQKRANAQNTLTIPVTIDASGRYTVPTDMVRSKLFSA
jgi:hypothetical protein